MIEKMLGGQSDLKKEPLETAKKVNFTDSEMPKETSFEQNEGLIRECGPEMAEYQKIYAETLERYDIDALYEIEDGEEAKANESRKEVMLVVTELIRRMQVIEEGSNVTMSELTSLQSQYKYLSRAIGIVNSGKVDHTR